MYLKFFNNFDEIYGPNKSLSSLVPVTGCYTLCYWYQLFEYLSIVIINKVLRVEINSC